MFFAVVVAGVAGTIAITLYAYRAINLVSASRSLDLGEAAIAEIEHSLENAVERILRSEAAGKLVGPDLARAYGKLGSKAYGTSEIDAALSIDGEGRVYYLSLAGERRSPERLPALTPGLARLVEAARETPPDGAKGFVRIADAVHFVAASVVAPLEGLARRAPEAPFVVLVARKIGPEYLADLGERYRLRNLRLVAGDREPPVPFLRLGAPHGAIIGTLAWDAERPGGAMLRRLAPGGGVMAIVLAAATVMFLRDAKATIAEHERAERALRALAKRLSSAEDRERRRFAAYLHDQIGQALALLQIKLGALAAASQAAPLRHGIAKISDLLAQVIEDTQSLILDLSPPVLRELGLGPALEQLGEQVCAANGLAFDFADDGCSGLLDADLAGRLFRRARAARERRQACSGEPCRRDGRTKRGRIARQRRRRRGRLRRREDRVPRRQGVRPVQPPRAIAPRRRAPRDRVPTRTHPRHPRRSPARPARGRGALVTVSILLVDDHKMMRDGLRALLEKHADMKVVGEAEDGRTAVRMVRARPPDVVLMDIAMPELNGIEATRQIKARAPEVKVIALSMHADRRLVAGILGAGASAFVHKSSAFEDVVEALTTVATKGFFISPKIVDIVMDDYVRRLARPEPETALSSREREVLQLLAEGNRRTSRNTRFAKA